MDYAALFAAGVAGMAVGLCAAAAAKRISDRLSETLIQSQRQLIAEQTTALSEAYEDCWRIDRALNSLRRNCFLTDTDGVRRRYDKVSRAVRERAEGSN